MSVLNFNGTDQYIEGSGSGALNGAMTVAVLVRHTTLGNTGCLMSTNSSAPAMGWSYFLQNNDRPVFYNDNEGGSPTDPGVGYEVDDTDEHFIVVMTRDTLSTARLHVLNSTGAGSWAHGDGVTPQTSFDPDSAAGGAVFVGAFNVPGAGLFDWFEGDMALHGLWNGVDMTDGQVEALGTNKHIDDWLDHAAGAPTSLTPWTSASPTDLQGLITWTNNGATLTGADPAGWTLTPSGGGGGTPTDDCYIKAGGVLVPSSSRIKVGGALYPPL